MLRPFPSLEQPCGAGTGGDPPEVEVEVKLFPAMTAPGSLPGLGAPSLEANLPRPGRVSRVLWDATWSPAMPHCCRPGSSDPPLARYDRIP